MNNLVINVVYYKETNSIIYMEKYLFVIEKYSILVVYYNIEYIIQ